MRPMWRDEALPRLRARGLGGDRAVRTLRLTGIGESLVADRLGEAILRAENPEVATYARADAVDVRLAAAARPAGSGQPARSADELLDEIEPVDPRRGRRARLGTRRDRPGARRSEPSSAGSAGRSRPASSAPAVRSSTLLGGPAWLARAEVVLARPRDAGPSDPVRRRRRDPGGRRGGRRARRRRPLARQDTAVSVGRRDPAPDRPSAEHGLPRRRARPVTVGARRRRRCSSRRSAARGSPRPPAPPPSCPMGD